MRRLTFETVEDVVFKHKNVLVLVLLFNFEGNIPRHHLVVGLIDETYKVSKLILVFREIKHSLPLLDQ